MVVCGTERATNIIEGFSGEKKRNIVGVRGMDVFRVCEPRR